MNKQESGSVFSWKKVFYGFSMAIILAMIFLMIGAMLIAKEAIGEIGFTILPGLSLFFACLISSTICANRVSNKRILYALGVGISTFLGLILINMLFISDGFNMQQMMISCLCALIACMLGGTISASMPHKRKRK